MRSPIHTYNILFQITVTRRFGRRRKDFEKTLKQTKSPRIKTTVHTLIFNQPNPIGSIPPSIDLYPLQPNRIHSSINRPISPPLQLLVVKTWREIVKEKFSICEKWNLSQQLFNFLSPFQCDK